MKRQIRKMKRKLKKKIPFLTRLTFEVNKLNIKIQNWGIQQQLKMSGMKIEYEPVKWYQRAYRYLLDFTPMVLAILLYINGHFWYGSFVLILGSLISSFISKKLPKIRFEFK